MEFRIIDSGWRFSDGHLRHCWFRLADARGRERVRAVTFRELAYLPIETRDDPDMLGKQWGALRGLYNADVDFCYTALGAFAPEHLGVAQFYGAAAEAETEAIAAAEARRRMAAVEATLANYPQSKLIPADIRRVRLLIERMERLRMLAILGHPDPRLAKKGLGRDGAMGIADDELLSQQGENLLRGLAKLREDFVFQVTSAHVARHEITGALVQMARYAGQVASRQRGNIGMGFSIAIPLAAALSNAYASNVGRSDSTAHSSADSVSQGWSQGESESWGHSVGQTQSHGTAHTESTVVTDGVGSAHSDSVSAGWGHTDSVANTASGAHTDSWAHTDSQAHTDSGSHTDSWVHTDSASASTAHTEGASWGTSDGVSSGSSTSQGHTDAAGSAQTTGSSFGVSAGASTGHTDSRSTGTSAGTSDTTGASSSHSDSAGQSDSVGGSVSAGLPGVVSGSASYDHGWTSGSSDTTGSSASQTATSGTSASTGSADSSGSSSSMSAGVSSASGTSQSSADSTGSSASTGSSHTASAGGSSSTTTTTTSGSADTTGGADTRGWADTTGTADTRGGADTSGWAKTQGSADSVSGSRGSTDTVSRMHSVASGVSDSESWGEAVSEGWSEGRSVARSEQAGRSHGEGVTAGQALAMSGGHAFSGGLSAGIVPGLSINRGWQTEDDVAIRLTEIARGLESLLNTASHEGGFLTTALMFVGEQGSRAAEALVPQSFHGPGVPTPVLTVPADESLRQHALAFRPSLEPDGDPFGIGLLWSKWGTLLTPAMLAAYTCPNLFEEGTAVTIQEKLPPLGFYPELPGEVVLGHQVSPETADLTTAPLRLARDRHFHTLFAGDTGFGKSVAAERMVYETTRHWQLRTVVLDFGAGWRKLLNAPGLAGHVEIRHLSPGGVRPLRWNPLQIGRYVPPEVQWRIFCDFFGTVARAGVRRQIPELREALRRVYLGSGVLVDDPECQRDRVWGVVRPGEAAVAGQPAGTRLNALPGPVRQQLAVARSQVIGLADLYSDIEAKLLLIPERDTTLRGVLEGILFRLHPLVQGQAARQYAAGLDAIDINAVVPGDWGIAILEGGKFLDDFSKAFLLGWAAWHFYNDAVIQRDELGVTGDARIQIVFEEANKILSGLDTGAEEETGGGVSVSEQLTNWWRDARKYGMWLHLITQSPSLIPTGILSSCNNMVVANLKNPKDRDAMIAALARSEKGFVDEPWRRFLASIPVARAVVKLGYTTDRAQVEPVYIQPLMLDVPAPSRDEIVARLGEIAV